jgi:predicted permease
VAALLDVILPVFLVIGAGYVAVWRRFFGEGTIDGLMCYTQGFAIPCLLLGAMVRIDLSAFEPRLLAAFYGGALACFFAGLLAARSLFRRPWEDSVAIGFVCLFSNSVMLGLAITERAYGTEALAANFAIVALHPPFCYLVGLTAMEIVRGRGAGAGAGGVGGRVLRAVFRNAMVLAIALGLVVNLSGLALPAVASEALGLVARTAIPVALFALGGVLYRYRPEGDMRVILFACAVSLLLHPALVWTFGTALALPEAAFRSAVVTAAMAPGVNAYVFASLYGVARRVAASAVLLGTAGSVVTAWFWLGLLGP